jgi:methylenetetrahydrofolate reductase (NADPH)
MDAQARIAGLIGTCSIELSPRDDLVGGALRQLFPLGTTVFVNHPPSITYHDVATACVRLRRAGFVPVPHVVARQFTGFTQARELLRRLADEAAVSHVLLLGGDAQRPLGPFHSALDLLSTGVVESQRMTSVAFAGYPEGHPAISSSMLQTALSAKLELARRRGLAPALVTQFGFEPQPILHWIAARRAEGIQCPIRVGLAGPASVATLAKYAMRCGIGASLGALTRGHAAIARILIEASPETLIRALVAGEDPAGPIDGLHIFTFGGVRRTGEWRASVIARSGAAARSPS